MTPGITELPPEQIAAQSGSSFLIGFLCLSVRRRAGMTAIYAFCRVVDDAVDDAPDRAAGAANLAFWREELDRVAEGRPATAVGRALQLAFRDFGGTTAPLDELLDGMAMDLRGESYADLEALEVYCHRVASAVGLACLPVLGVTSERACDYAEWLGKALQLTNISRDLYSDAQAGRVYVPRTWLEELSVEPTWLAGEGPPPAYLDDGPVARLCARLNETALDRFRRANEALGSMRIGERRRLVPARIMGAVYRDLLRRLQRRKGQVTCREMRVPKARKLWLASGVLLGVRA